MTGLRLRLTLCAPAVLEGIGLFTERPVRCRVLPAEPGLGIAFARADLPGSPAIPATADSITSRPVHPAFASIPPRHTALAAPGSPETIVYTTEHVLSALAGLHVTDALVELDAPEVPIGDGSAQPFTDAIMRAGLRDLGGTIEPITLREAVRVQSRDGLASITAEPLGPGEAPMYRYELDYGPGAPIQPHTAEWRGAPEAFLREVAPARTFSLRTEAEQMHSLGLFRSFSPRDLLVIDSSGEPIESSWRFPDEPARHKLLDLIGDLALAGRPLHARIVARRAGHALNHALARELAGR